MNKLQLLTLLKASDWNLYKVYWYTLTFPVGTDTIKTPTDFIDSISEKYNITIQTWYVQELTKKNMIHYHGILRFSNFEEDKPTPAKMRACWPYLIKSVDRLYKHYKITKLKRYVLESVVTYIYKENINSISYFKLQTL